MCEGLELVGLDYFKVALLFADYIESAYKVAFKY